MSNIVAISVVVPFFNAECMILECLRGIMNQTLQPLEVILVDNNSSDHSANLVKQFIEQNGLGNYHYVYESLQGPSYARNSGVNQSKGEILAFTDSDCIPEANWLSELSRAFGDPQIGATAGRILGYQGESVLEKFHSMFTLKGLDKDEILSNFTLVKGGFPTANLAVKKEIFEQIGGFDDTMKPSGEDYDLCARIYQAGFDIHYTPRAIVFHKHRNTLNGTWIQSFWFGRAHSVLIKKHFERIVIIDLPRCQYISKRWPAHVWIDLASADKKMVALIALSVVWWPVSIFLMYYLFYLFNYMKFRLRQNNVKAGCLEKWEFVFLLFFKSFAITLGRVIGSIHNRVICF